LHFFFEKKKKVQKKCGLRQLVVKKNAPFFPAFFSFFTMKQSKTKKIQAEEKKRFSGIWRKKIRRGQKS
jgi:hypothetical protein